MKHITHLTENQRAEVAARLGAAMREVALEFDVEPESMVETFVSARNRTQIGIVEAANYSNETVRRDIGWTAENQFGHVVDCAVHGIEPVDHIDTASVTEHVPSGKFRGTGAIIEGTEFREGYILSTRNPFGIWWRWNQVHGAKMHYAQVRSLEEYHGIKKTEDNTVYG